ncbi:Na+/H+ antiporter NhaC [Dysgonomonas sp. PFB1-18]|uniref:Na+/H+ antiporter NhaC family protein n=1 Tax=unclassified Dysgonomonas TaxID=2630389 RepID=UPI002474E9A3|nr:MULTISPECIES: Na+/H+ antiporter NhaC family protein [unclassified Dysgonomonas]MDH6307692.1 Na+/H+ antiporter NhaC [Dysgonomonas sp. PF1-14]MDH6337610.1 Na+/H+ antiporter NhaC [Dysgonomonas sp. PF1-16]MDH6378834.1 Na+/H+ antiporter NhaC [Dysgonomonas sp. PFB1-18]MDH6396469.1 Na+/H+ antiporter NhaC [Dysgonomonas sp. PF1-23]
MDKYRKWYHSKGWALIPLAVFFLLYVLTFIFTGDLYQMPVSVAFMAASVAAVLYSKGGKLSNRITQFCRGAANETIMLMVVIFILAGAFAGTAKAMGAVDATVNMMLYLLPQKTILASVFIAACFISMSMGTSTGTIAALAPIAVGVSAQAGIDLPLMLGVVVGGAMFGDNLSFISDTTIVATRTQGCNMQDKFKVNIRIVLPVVLIVLGIYIYQGLELTGGTPVSFDQVEWLKVLPYLAVLIAALAGVNVMAVLALGIILSGAIGLFTGGFGVWDWTKAMSNGIVVDMGELIIVSLMAGGMFELIRFNGGIDWLIEKMTRNIRSKRSAEFSIAGLISFTNLCTANNTIALIISGPIAKNISDKFDLDNRKIASLLDTFSCFVQGLIPYGAQLLIAAGLAKVSPMEIVPNLYYPFLIGIAAVASIVFRYPRKYA